MKRTHKIAGAALLATVAVGVGLSAQTNASTSMTGKGTVKFTEGTQTTNPDNKVPDDTDGPIIVEPTQNTNLGKQRIISVTDMDFFEHKALETETAYDALPFKTKRADDQTDISMPHFVRFQDVRSGSDITVNNFLIQAQISKQFTNTGTAANVLTGSTIEYKDARLTTSYAEYVNNVPDDAAALPPGAKVVKHGEATDMVSWAGDPTNINLGYGTFEITFGEQSDVDSNSYDSVTLHRQPGVTVREGTYLAEITWTIGNVPTP